MEQEDNYKNKRSKSKYLPNFLKRSRLPARSSLLELLNVELLVNHTHVEVDIIRRWQINPDLINIEPQQELLHLNALETRDGAVLEITRDDAIVVDHVVKLDVAGTVQFDGEVAACGYIEGAYRVRQDSRRKAVVQQELVDFVVGGGKREKKR